jgi:ribonuclease E
MLETEPTNRQPDPSEPEGSRQSGGQPDESGQSGTETSQRRGLLRRTRRSVAKPADPPAFSSGGSGQAPPAGTTRGQAGASAEPAAGKRTSAPVPAVPTVPAVAPAQFRDQPSGSHQPVPPAAFQAPVVVFQPPDLTERRAPASPPSSVTGTVTPAGPGPSSDADDDADSPGSASRRRRRGGRGRGKGTTSDAATGSAPATGQSGAGGEAAPSAASTESAPAGDQRKSGTESRPEQSKNGSAQAKGTESAERSDGDSDEPGTSSSSRRRRRRRQRGGTVGTESEAPAPDDPTDTVVHVREPRPPATESDDVRSVKGSTRLEAKRQRRRESRDTGRRRPPIISESEFLARREAVERVMLVRQQGDRTQIAVLEDDILVEHYVDKASSQSYVGNVYLGKVQNVLPSMEAAFVDIGKGRNAVLYAGEVNFDASGLEGVAKRIESALKSGQSIMVQVTKDPIGHKGARLTSQVSLPGRYLVYVPGASMTGISRKLPDTERTRLKQILKKVAPEEGGIIVRTAAEGASEEELQHDVTRLVAQWQAIERKAKTASAPDLLYGEPDLTIRVVRDIFNEDFTKLVIASDSEWDLVDEYVRYVAPTLSDRLERWGADGDSDADLFAEYRIDEQLAKALDRKVWLPSGGSLVIDTTEAMTVVDVNTGKFTGQGGNLEQTVTRNNLEAAEEIVRQLRLRDIGGIIVIDFIDMVLESNRDLVLRRLIECLARDRTKHQVAEVTSLGLVQMTRKRVGSGLLAAFSVPCEHCNGRGVLVSTDLTEVPHSHGRNGQPSTPKPGPGRSRSARSKAIAQVAAKTVEPPAGEAEAAHVAADGEPEAATQAPATGSMAEAGPSGATHPSGANKQPGGSRSGSGRSGNSRSRRGESAPAAQPAGADLAAANPAAASSNAASSNAAESNAAESAGAESAGAESARLDPTSAGGRSANGQRSAPTAKAAHATSQELAQGTPSNGQSAGLTSSGPEDEAEAPKRRVRRSAYRQAGPPDSAQSVSAVSQVAPSDPAPSAAPVAAQPAEASASPSTPGDQDGAQAGSADAASPARDEPAGAPAASTDSAASTGPAGVESATEPSDSAVAGTEQRSDD